MFFDDDNIAATDYLAEALRLKQDNPKLGAFGSGAIVPEFEDAPATYLSRYLGYLALREVDAPKLSRDGMSKHSKPWGAGLCVRSSVAAAYCEAHSQVRLAISGRRGEELQGGEDDEISIIACRNGNEIGIFPSLRLTHLIPKQRLGERYLIKIREGLALSDLLLAYKWDGRIPDDPASVGGRLGLVKNLLLRRGIDLKMYLAYRRAAGKALEVIRHHEARMSASQKRTVDDVPPTASAGPPSRLNSEDKP